MNFAWFQVGNDLIGAVFPWSLTTWTNMANFDGLALTLKEQSGEK